jgi:hypothetical protein
MQIDHEDGRSVKCKTNGTSGVMLTLSQRDTRLPNGVNSVVMALRKDEAKILATALIEYSKG